MNDECKWVVKEKYMLTVNDFRKYVHRLHLHDIHDKMKPTPYLFATSYFLHEGVYLGITTRTKGIMGRYPAH